MRRQIRCENITELYSTCELLFPKLKIQFDGSRDDPCEYHIEITKLEGVKVSAVRNSLAMRMVAQDEDRLLTLGFVDRGLNVVARKGRDVATAPGGDCTISSLRGGDVVKVGPGSARLLVQIDHARIDDAIVRHFHVAPPASIDFPSVLRGGQPQRAILGDLVRYVLIGLESAEGPFAAVLAKQYSDLILSSLLLMVPNSFASILGKAGDAATTRYVKRALDYIHANLDKPIDLEDIARNALCSPRRLQLAFRAEFGMTPMNYLKMERLGLAEQRLRNGDCGDVTSLALSLGFTNPGRFAREFRQKFGILPSEILASGPILGRASPK
jgi:AraC-like DNA-binding protein